MKLAVAGCMGRMGQSLMQAINEKDGVTLVGGTAQTSELQNANMLKAQLSLADDVLITDNLEALLDIADGIIDFTSPAYTLQIAQACANIGKVHISGTTGFNEKDSAEFAQYGEKAQIVHAPNMSIAVNVFMQLTQQVASILDDDFDIEIVEMHHRKKVDAPSGTALGLGLAAAKGRGVKLDDVMHSGRDGITGERPKGEIGFATLRGGDVVGDHTVTFAGSGERLELTHKASNRSIYASGAIRAALWANTQQSGYYSMTDVLGL